MSTAALLLTVVIVLAVAILVLLFLLLRRSAAVTKIGDPGPRPPLEEAAPPPDAQKEGGTSGTLRAVFDRARKLFNASAADDRYSLPFFAVVGAEGARDSDMFEGAGLDMPFGTPAAARVALGHGRGFWFFGRGAVIDLVGPAVLQSDGRGADDAAWNATLGELLRLRPKRPIDGAVLCIPASELRAAASNDLAMSELAARTGRLYRRLNELQQQLGFRLPAYILVTQCETLTGFDALASPLLPAVRREMLGWSNPYAVETAYRGEWIDDAMSSLASRVADLQLELFTHGASDGAALLQLTREMQTLATPLRTAADQIFRSSVYNAELMLRGIYFCGRAAGGDSAVQQLAPQTAFLADVLQEKVFLENGLATPSARLVNARNRAVRVARMATVSAAALFTTALIWSAFSLKEQRAELLPFLQQVGRDTQWMRARPHDPGDPDLQAAARRLLAGMATIRFNSYGSVFVPWSWPVVTSANDEIEDAMGDAFQSLILVAIRDKLIERGRDIINEASTRIVPVALRLSPATDDAIVPVDDLPSVAALTKYVANLKKLETNELIYNAVASADSGSAKDLEALVLYAFNERLPPSFTTQSRLYQRALEKSAGKQLKLENFRGDAGGQADQLVAQVYREVFAANPLLVRVRSTSAAMQDLVSNPPAAAETSRLSAIAAQLRGLSSALTRPELAWVFARDFDLGPKFSAALVDMDRLQFIGKPSSDRMRDAGRSYWRQFRQELTRPAPLTGALIASAGNELQPQLSPDAVLLQASLDGFLTQRFVAAPGRGHRLHTQLDEGQRFTWDPAMLEQAAAVALAYDRFRQNNLRLFPLEVRAGIDGVARQRAAGEMYEDVAAAQRFEIAPAMNEEELRSEVTAFASAMQPLGDVLDGFARLGFEEPRRDLAAALTSDAARMLAAADRLLGAESPYLPRGGDFSAWDGAAAVSPASWDAADAAELTAYLDATRNRVATMARSYALPLLTALGKAGTRGRTDVAALSVRWQSIVDDLNAYDAKRPGNGVAALETYIGTTLAKVRPNDCSAAALPTGFRGGRGFFASRIEKLSSAASAQCFALSGSDAAKRYVDLQQFFTARLKDRYPFTAGLPNDGALEADPADLRVFFRKFDAVQPLVKAMPPGRFAAAQHFVDEMTKVRKFFEAFLDGTKDELAPSFDVEPSFRILRDRERGADHIIDWTLTLGDQTIRSRDKMRAIRWTAGKPVRLSLRWASNAPTVPTLRTPQRGASVNGRTLTFEYPNRWALLTALQEHRPTGEQLPAFVDAKPYTLSVAVDTAAADAAAKSETAPSATVVFLRLAVLTPGPGAAVEIPKFPTSAPELPAEEQP